MSYKKERIPLGVRQELEDVDYWHKLSKTKKAVLSDGTESQYTEYEYMKKLMHEMYGKGFYKFQAKDNILKSKEHKQWAIRNNNMTNRDALNVAKKTKRLNNDDFLIERGSKDEPEAWEKTLKYNTINTTLEHILELAAKELNIELTKESRSAILKIYTRLRKLMAHIRKDRQNKMKKCIKCGRNKNRKEYHKHRSAQDGRRKKCKQCYGEK